MTIKYLVVDTATGIEKLGNAVGGAGSLYIDQYFTATSNQTVFTASQVFTGGSNIDVLQNGIEQREGASFIYQRNTGANTIVFNTGVQVNAEIKIRIWL